MGTDYPTSTHGKSGNPEVIRQLAGEGFPTGQQACSFPFFLSETRTVTERDIEGERDRDLRAGRELERDVQATEFLVRPSFLPGVQPVLLLIRIWPSQRLALVGPRL